MAVDPDDPRIRNARPGWALVILAAPVVLLVFVATAYAVLLGFGLAGRAAGGEHRTVSFRACPDARPVIEARVADVGLTDAVFADVPGGFTLSATLPADPAVADALPATLARPGHLEVRHGDEVLLTDADVVDAGVRLDMVMIPSTLLRLSPEAARRVTAWREAHHPDGVLEYVLDGAVIGTQQAQYPVEPGELEIAPEGLPDRERMQVAAEWSVVIDHGPLPCPVTVP